MDEAKIMESIMKNAKDIAALQESSKSAHKRIDENDRVTNGIYDLSNNVAGMTVEVKAIGERMEESNRRTNASIELISAGQKSQGERIGKLENAFISLADLPKSIDKLSAKVDAMEKEPAAKWKNLVSQLISIVVASVFGGIITVVGGIFLGLL